MATTVTMESLAAGTANDELLAMSISGNRLSKKIIDDRADLQKLIDSELKEAIEDCRISN